MANEPEKRNTSRLDELEELSQEDRITQIQFNVPELKEFSAASVFEVEEKEPPKHKIFGKRSARRSTVRIRQDLIQEEPEPQSEPEPAAQPEPVEPTVFSSSEDVAPAVDELDHPAVEVASEQEDKEPAIEISIDEKVEVTGSEEDASGEDEEEYEESDDDEYEEDEDEDYEEEEEDGDDEDTDDEDSEDDDSDEYYEDEPELFEDKKRFLLSQYPIVEDYLSEQAREGYYFVRQQGHKYYFTQGEPKNYYYSIDYFKNEPSASEWRQWEKDGWKLVSRAPAKKKREAGWFVFRNEEEEGGFPKSIDNEAEKYRFFRKYANSCRSTLFLIFICMACCLVTGFLQWQFQGYLWAMALCAGLFVICLIVFIQYSRMLRHAKKRARMLQAKLRIKEKQDNDRRALDDSYDLSENEADLESDWDNLEK